MMFGARPAEDVGLDGLPGPPCTRDHPLFGLREPVPQVERHHLVDPELEVGAQQVNGYRVPVRTADLLDAIPPLDRKRT